MKQPSSHIAKISRYSTLYPGDVVWLGAEGATPDMRPGDVVEIEISGIGTLRNAVVAEAVAEMEELAECIALPPIPPPHLTRLRELYAHGFQG